jgi:hypothetical protein
MPPGTLLLTITDLGTTYLYYCAWTYTDVDTLPLPSVQFDIDICDYVGLGTTFIRVLTFIGKLHTAFMMPVAILFRSLRSGVQLFHEYKMSLVELKGVLIQRELQAQKLFCTRLSSRQRQSDLVAALPDNYFGQSSIVWVACVTSLYLVESSI